MKYIITASYEGTISTVETNDIEMLFKTFRSHIQAPHLCITDGTTGEVLMHSGPEPYFTPSFMMLMMAWILPQVYD